jgi:hypothetical protein
VGHLYQGRYKAILVEKEPYLSILSRYIHLNPVRVAQFEKSSQGQKAEHLLLYPWSSLPGYLDKSKRTGAIDHSLVLAEYGGDTSKGRAAYRKQLLTDIDEEFDVKGNIYGQGILGGGDFITWVKETFLGENKTREQPLAGKIRRYQQKEAILAVIEEQTGRGLEALKDEKGDLRRLAMDLLCRHGGLKGPEVGALFDVGYSAVSQERKRLREHIARDRELEKVMCRLEGKLSTIKI